MAAAKPTSDHGSSWRSHPTFTMLVVGFGIFSDQFLFAVLTPVLPFILTEHLNIPKHDIQSATSASLAAFFITSIVSPIPVAYFGRHASYRRFMYLFGLACLTVATVMLYFARSFAVFVASRVLQGTSGSVVWIIGLGMLCDAVGSGHLGQAVGSVWGMAMVGAMAAPAIGGALYRFAGYKGIFIVSLIILALDFVFRLLVLDPDRSYRQAYISDSESPGTATPTNITERTPLVNSENSSYSTTPPSPTKITTASTSRLLNRVPILKTMLSPVMWISLAIILLLSIFLSFIDATIPLRLRQTLDFDAFDSGLMLLTITGTTCIIGPIAGYLVDHYEPRYLALAGHIITAIGVCALGLPLSEARAARIASFAVYLAVMGVGLATLDSPAFVASAKLVEDLYEAEPFNFGDDPPYVEHQAILYIAFSIGMVTGPSVAAGAVKILPFWAIVEILGATSLGMGILAFLYLR